MNVRFVYPTIDPIFEIPSLLIQREDGVGPVGYYDNPVYSCSNVKKNVLKLSMKLFD